MREHHSRLPLASAGLQREGLPFLVAGCHYLSLPSGTVSTQDRPQSSFDGEPLDAGLQ